MSILFMRQAGAQQTIDVHCHNILPGYMAVLEKHDAAMEPFRFPRGMWNRISLSCAKRDQDIPF